MLPLQSEKKPSFLIVVEKQLNIPLYGLSSQPHLITAFWFCIESFIRSNEATAAIRTAVVAKFFTRLAALFSGGAPIKAGDIGFTTDEALPWIIGIDYL
ncbi:hypothetical protein V6N13_084501 [Hibiscus sabdariffa]